MKLTNNEIVGSQTCDCSGWSLGIWQIQNAMNYLETCGANYSGKTFGYCPWCGKKLKLGHKAEG